MRENWTYKTFGEVGSFLRGKSIQKGDFVESGMPCIHYGQIHTKFGIATDKHLSEIPLELYDKSIIASPGDLIIAITSEDLEGSCKSTAWLGKYDVAVSAHAAVYKHNLNPKFIAYYLRSNSFCVEKEKYARGFKVMEIKPNDIARIPLPIPSLSEQQSIVAELDKINELISLKKAQLSDLDNLAQSIFYDMFGDPIENEKGWEVKKMMDLCTNIVDCPHSTPKKSDFVTDYPCIRTSELKGGSISWDTMQYLEKEEYEIRIARLKPEAGDIVFGREGTIGDAVILPQGYNFSLGQRTMLLRANTEIISNVFLHRVILSEWMKQQIEYVNVSSTVAHVNIKDFKQFTVPLPPLSLQQEFARRIELIEQQKAQISSTIKDLETLLASRMQYWFD